MYLFILESIGTSELILIGLVALIIFGPRKLPDMLRSFGKAMGEFRRSTDEFKQTWEREVAFEEAKTNTPQNLSTGKTTNTQETISRDSIEAEYKTITPEIKELSGQEFDEMIKKETAQVQEKVENDTPDKREWL